MEENTSNSFYEEILNDEFILDKSKRLSSSYSAEVYIGRRLNTNELVAIKLEEYSNNLNKEYEIYQKLKGIERIPKIYSFDYHKGEPYLAMELLGDNLLKYMDLLDGRFSLATTLKLAVQILRIVKQIHKRGVILRYLKPENMAMGYGENKNYLYLFDFDFAKKYIKYGEHIPYKTNKSRKGNIKFISVNAQLGRQISRRDDIESFGYNLIYFMEGRLPWSRYSNYEEKYEMSLDDLCEDLPKEFKEIIHYSKKLEFTEEPDYDYLEKLLFKAAESNYIDIDSVEYDWEIKEKKNQKLNQVIPDENPITQEKKENIIKIENNKDDDVNAEKCEKKIIDDIGNDNIMDIDVQNKVNINSEEKNESDKNKENIEEKGNICDLEKNNNVVEQNAILEEKKDNKIIDNSVTNNEIKESIVGNEMNLSSSNKDKKIEENIRKTEDNIASLEKIIQDKIVEVKYMINNLEIIKAKVEINDEKKLINYVEGEKKEVEKSEQNKSNQALKEEDIIKNIEIIDEKIKEIMKLMEKIKLANKINN